MNKIEKLWKYFKKEDLLEDRSEYDEEDLQKAYPQLTKDEAEKLYKKLQKWRLENG